MNHNLLRLKTVLLFQPPKQTLGKSSQLAYVINNHNFKSVLITALLFQDSMNKVDLGCSGDTPKSGTLSTTVNQQSSPKSNRNQPITAQHFPSIVPHFVRKFSPPHLTVTFSLTIVIREVLGTR